MTTEFWNTIRDCDGDPDRLKHILSGKSDNEVSQFGREFYQALINLNRWQIWGAGDVMVADMSDDGFHYFRSWIIGRGQEAYEMALTSPDELGRFAREADQFENEALEYAAIHILEERGLSDPRDDIEATADDEPTGTPFDPDHHATHFPKLSAQFG